MTEPVPDTGMIEAFRPLKTGGGGSQDRPTCANCPCGSKDAHGSQGVLVCTRYPPEMQMTVKQTVAGLQQVPQVGFKPVHPSMVCWEHPVLQARMRRAVDIADQRAAMKPGRFVEVSERTRQAMEDGEGHHLLSVHAIGDPEPAAVQEADGRKPGDEG